MDSVSFYGFLVGLLFGYILQRGRVCYNSAIRDVKYFHDNFLIKAVALGLGLNAILFTLLAQVGLLKLAPLSLMPAGNIVGGLLFGIGMVLVGGCASGVTYRVGEGLTTAWLGALFFGLFAAAAGNSFLAPVRSILRGPVFTVFGGGTYYAHQAVGPTVANTLGINPWIPAVVFAAIMFAYAFGTKTTKRPSSPWRWPLIAVMAAVVSIIAYVLRQYVEYYPAYGLGITGGWVNLLKYVTGGAYAGWSGALILGIIVGAAISALAHKEFKLRMPRRPQAYVPVIAGGALMGFGASLAGGCNIGHILTGVPHLAWGSLLAAGFIILGNWLGYYLVYGRK
jgi:uncharacterized membrane protein YedE/YeeE